MTAYGSWCTVVLNALESTVVGPAQRVRICGVGMLKKMDGFYCGKGQQKSSTHHLPSARRI